MKAVQISNFGDETVLKMNKSYTLEKPKPGQVLVKVSFVGVNPVETYQRSGAFGPLPFPWTPGSDCSGLVVEVGEAVTKVKPGQRVYTTKSLTGTYASHTLVDEAHVHLLPDCVSFQEGAALGVPYFTAFDALFQHDHCKPGETVLIHGASGGVGIAAVQLARAAGLVIIGTAGTDVGLKAIKDQGCHHVFNHRESNYQQKMKDAFPGGVNLVLEMFADRNMQFDIDLLAMRGRVIVIGSRGIAKIDFITTMVKLIKIQGILLFFNSDEIYAEAAKSLGGLMEQKKVKPIIWKEIPLEKAVDAHKEIINNSGICGKIILKVD